MKLKLVLKLFVFSLFMLSCSKEENEIVNPNEDNNGTEESYSLKLKSIEKGGCFDEEDIDLKSAWPRTDTLYYSVSNDSLFLNLSLVQNCGACLLDSMSIINQNVDIYVRDACGVSANCICNFDYKYAFENFKDENIHFTIYYKDYSLSEYIFRNEIEYP